MAINASTKVIAKNKEINDLLIWTCVPPAKKRINKSLNNNSQKLYTTVTRKFDL